MRYTYDINGILVVDVHVVSTGQEKQLVIRNDKIKLSEEELKKRLEQLNKLKIHPRDLEENRLVLARAEKLHREHNGIYSGNRLIVVYSILIIIWEDRMSSPSTRAENS